MMPISAITLKSMWKMQERQDGAHAGRRQRGENRDGMDVALVQHAQHDVHGDDGRQNQDRLVGQRGLEGLRPFLGSLPWMLAGSPIRALGLLDRLGNGFAQ
jgi:hypothetical protein